MINLWFAWKKSIKTFSKERKKTFSLIIILSMTFGLGTLFDDLFGARAINFTHYVEMTDMADGMIIIEPAPASKVNDIMLNYTTGSSKEMLKAYESRLFFITDFDFKSVEAEQGILVGVNMSAKSHLNNIVYPNKTGHVLPNNTFGYGYWSVHQEISLGSTINFSYGEKCVQYPIEAIGYSPEWYYYPINELGHSFSFNNPPVFYADLKRFCEDLGFPVIVNQILFQLNDSNGLNQLKKEIVKCFDDEGIRVVKVLPFEDFPGISTQVMEIENSVIIGPIMINLFFFFGLVILLVMIYRFIEKDKKQIGVFQSIGIYKSEVLLAYVLYVVELIGLCLFIGLMGRFILGKQFIEAQMNTIGVPYVSEMPLFPTATMNALILMASLSILIISIIVFKVFRMDSSEVLRSEAKYLRKPNLIEKLLRAIKRKDLKPFGKFSLRSIFMRKGLLATTLIVIIFSQAMIFMGLGLLNVWDELVRYKYIEIEKWDGYAFTWDLGDNRNVARDIEKLPEIDFSEVGFIGSSEILLVSDQDAESLPIMVLSFQNDSKLHQFPLREGRLFNNTQELIISEDVVIKESFKIGDHLVLKQPIAGDSNSNITFEIVGFSADSQASAVFMSLEDAASLMNVTMAINIIYFSLVSGQAFESSDIIEQIEEMDEVAQVVLKGDALNQMAELMSNFSGLYTIVGAGIILLSLAAIFIIMKSVINYRTEDYLNLKAIGIHGSEIWRGLLLEMALLLGICLPTGTFLMDFLMDSMSNAFRQFMPGITLGISTDLMIIVWIMTALVAFLAVSLAMLGLRKRSIEEIIRRKEFG